MADDSEQYESTRRVRASLKQRYRRERRFRSYGVVAIAIGLGALLVLFADIISKGLPAFQLTHIQLEISWDPDRLGIDRLSPETIDHADFEALIHTALRQRFPAANTRAELRQLYDLVSIGARYRLREMLRENPSLLGNTKRMWLVADDQIDVYFKASPSEQAKSRHVTDLQEHWIQQLQQAGAIELRFNTNFFTSGNSRNPEQAGIWGAVVGSFLTMVVTLVLSFPLGVGAAIYLEEFAPQNRFTELIEVNINNLAAVPSIIFGLLGLAVFINFFGLPRSVPLVGGMVLTLMALPTIIISSRNAIKAVPPSVREAALGMGASRMQVVLHHVLPLAMPGILTGVVIAMSQALGETAPLLMIGMVAFIVDIPSGFMDPATVLPVQIFLWAKSPEQSFTALASAAIMVLLAFLILMNTLAVVMRKKLEKRW